ncbi:MAG TPA: hypothetical protein VGY13_06645 [Solirubrobacteraceae bacterium]|nr:hypothetical protein [Solirubrobacteraceae bacterium]
MQITVPPCDGFEVTVVNTGGVSASGPVTVTDTLPAGLKVVGVAFFWAENRLKEPIPVEPSSGNSLYPENNEGTATSWCRTTGAPARVSCEFTPEVGVLHPDQRLQMDIFVTVEEGATSGESSAAVAEAGQLVGSSVVADSVGGSPAFFGPSAFVSEIAGADGLADVQAGDHPFELGTRIDLDSALQVTPENKLEVAAVDQPRDVVVDLPLGFVGSAQATPKCTFGELEGVVGHACPLDSLLGFISTEPHGLVAAQSGIYNMVPEGGVAAEFGFKDLLHNTHVIVANVAPTPAGYVLRAVGHEVPQVALASILTSFYGEPGPRQKEAAELEGETVPAIPPVAMFTNSTDCSGEPLKTTVFMDSWQQPGSFNANGTPKIEEGPGSHGWASMSTESPPVTGCGALRFQPSAFTVKPDTTMADSATGLTFDLKLPQDEEPGQLATPALRAATVALPPGLTVSPSAATGLAACSAAQIGWLGPVSPSNPGYTNFTAEAPACPEASRIGSVEVSSPLIETTLVGSVYVARQYENPYGSLFAGYIVIDDPATGTIVKVPGELRTNQETGQITGVFDDNPQIPFSELKIRFFGGQRGDLATPESCGSYTTASVLEPWSAPESGPDATPSDSFEIDNGCVSGFAPAFAAGTTSPQAGAFSSFTLSVSREDDEQGLRGLAVTLPSGVVGRLAGVAECSEAQLQATEARSHPGEAAAELASPSCPESSLLGSVTSIEGAGTQPFSISGKVYLTGPYRGAPYGLAVVVPATAGPFDLGVVVVRQALYINPQTSQVTDVSDPIPTIRDGIPLRIKRIEVAIDRPGFTLNPTSCDPEAVTATATSTAGAQAPLSARFQAAGCASLAFTPKITATTAAHASKLDGASLDLKISYPKGALGTQSNFQETKLEFPAQLPARLGTIQRACLAATFEANPANCPTESAIGHVTVHTELLSEPLVGPIYFVSYGNKKFPEAVMVLQGDNVEIVLHGETYIDNKTSVISATFDNTPDVPFENIEVSVPSGPYSEFGTDIPEKDHYDLCGQKLVMPTLFKAQNGLEIDENTTIGVSGCPKTKTRAQKLAAALKACEKDKKSKRAACEAQARKSYGPTKKTKKANRKK